MKVLLRGYHSHKISGKAKFIDHVYGRKDTMSIFHTWNVFNYLHPKTTYLVHEIDLYTLYFLKSFLYLLILKLLRRPIEEIVIDSQENIFLIGLVRRLGFENVSLVFYDLASKNSLGRPKSRRFVAQVNTIIVMTETIKRDLMRAMPCLDPQRIKVIPYKTDKGVFHPFLAEEKVTFKNEKNLSNPFILYVGSEQPRKNLFTLLAAFRSLSTDFPNLIFIKIGRDQDRSNRAILNNILGSDAELDSRFVLIEDCSDGDLAGYYNTAEVFVFPSLYEGFGIPLVEAMASGASIVASRIETTMEICGSAVRYIEDPINPEEYREAIKGLLKDRKLREALEQQSLIRSKVFLS